MVCDLPVALLNEAPKYTREGVESEEIRAKRERDLSGVPVPGDLGAVLVELLSHPTIASKRPIFERYDHQVMTNTVVAPYRPFGETRTRLGKPPSATSCVIWKSAPKT